MGGEEEEEGQEGEGEEPIYDDPWDLKPNFLSGLEIEYEVCAYCLAHRKSISTFLHGQCSFSFEILVLMDS